MSLFAQELIADYVVVGAGASGSVLAGKLAQKLKHDKIMILEAGSSNDKFFIRDFRESLFIPPEEQAKIDWGIKSVPQKYMNNRIINASRAKVLGGCSSINQCLWVRGSPEDFNKFWPKNWSWDKVINNYKNLENVQEKDVFDPTIRGFNGPLHISNFQSRKNKIAHEVHKACVAAGYTPVKDYNAPFAEQQVCSLMQFNVDAKNVRHDAYSTFLHPFISQSNVELVTEAHVLKIHFKTINCAPRATAVEFLKHGKKYLVHVKEEVILCAGAINSPHLLQVSGIGSAELLGKFGIPVIKDLPAVGENMQDHLITFSKWELNVELPKDHNNLVDVNMFVKDEDGRYPLQMYNIIFPRDTLGVKGSTFCIESILNCPESTGFVRLQSADPTVLPHVDYNFLKSQKDVQIITDGIRRHRKITAHLKHIVGKEIGPGVQAQSDEDIAAYIREIAFPIFHPSCTCTMTETFDPKHSVVDPNCRVWGIDGLRVADASVQPAIVSGNIHACCLMIGDRVAELIIAERQKKCLYSSL